MSLSFNEKHRKVFEEEVAYQIQKLREALEMRGQTQSDSDFMRGQIYAFKQIGEMLRDSQSEAERD